MTDTEDQKTVEIVVEEDKVEEKEKVSEKDEKEETQAENGDKKDTEEKDEEPEEVEECPKDKCSIKRKSTGGDAVDGKPEESTPEKKAKLDDAAPAVEANGEVTEAEVAA